MLGEVEWATFDDPQAESLLAGEVVHTVPYIPPRGYAQVARAVPTAVKLLSGGRFARMISTGSGIALAFVPVARSFGVAAHYVESAARAEGPSMTGRLVSHVPGTRLYAQYPSWAGRSWQYRGSLFDDFRPAQRAVTSTQAKRVVITLGTMRGYGFRRAVEHLVRVVPHVLAGDAQVLWQVGCTDVSGLPVDPRTEVPSAELHRAIAEADLVVAHAGIGSCLAALDAGRCPVIVARQPELGEHVDAHQRMIAAELDRRGLAVWRRPEELTAADLVTAMSRTVERLDTPGPFALADTLRDARTTGHHGAHVADHTPRRPLRRAS
ncbi:UDP-N-acetylglucosamine transferase subunit ALG13 [Georgenia muralis]|uniref:UDP-N-acetylglucosamine transferase subunit ALG13 n=1 Tax=Georgenia muralis TaxID=154117 RepID=A0A3N4Z0I4_9MICO|nr:UDP-N-acetylglucosamine transferase subunit ALG13 [Georgenia muralis]